MYNRGSAKTFVSIICVVFPTCQVRVVRFHVSCPPDQSGPPPDLDHKEFAKIYQIECLKECQKICQAHMPEIMLDRMPDKVPEQMSERMSE